MDSYITLAELDTLVPTVVTSAELAKVGWSTLTVADKTVYLKRSMRAIESLFWRGNKKDLTQVLSFPRLIFSKDFGPYATYFPVMSTGMGSPSTPNGQYSGWVDTGIPDELKNAVAHMTVVAILEATDNRKKLMLAGVKIMSAAGKVNEVYRDDIDLMRLRVPKWLEEDYLKKYVTRGSIGI